MKAALKLSLGLVGAGVVICACATDLGPWVVTDMNEAGVMVGFRAGELIQPVRYVAGTLQELAPPGYIYADAIAEDGTIAGHDDGVLVIWAPDGSRANAGRFAGVFTYPVAINRSRTIVGRADTVTRSWIYEDGRFAELLAPPWLIGRTIVGVNDLNDAGEAIGTISNERLPNEFTLFAARWAPGSRTATWTSGAGCQANAINDAGTIAGDCNGRPAVWPAGAAHPVLLQTAGYRVAVHDINDQGVVVGSVFELLQSPFLFAETAAKWPLAETGPGSVVLLHQPYTQQSGPTKYETRALRINNQGTIVGLRFNSEDRRTLRFE